MCSLPRPPSTTTSSSSSTSARSSSTSSLIYCCIFVFHLNLLLQLHLPTAPAPLAAAVPYSFLLILLFYWPPLIVAALLSYSSEFCKLRSKSNKDPARIYIHLVDPKDTNAAASNYCSKATKCGIYLAKQYLIGGFKNVVSCKKFLKPVKEEIENTCKRKKKKKWSKLICYLIWMLWWMKEMNEEVKIDGVWKKAVCSLQASSLKSNAKRAIGMHSTPPI